MHAGSNFNPCYTQSGYVLCECGFFLCVTCGSMHVSVHAATNLAPPPCKTHGSICLASHLISMKYTLCFACVLVLMCVLE